MVGGVVGVHEYVPLVATIVGLGVHATGLPLESLTVIVFPGVPVPLIVVPLVGLTVGVVAGAATGVGVVLPAGSVVVAGPTGVRLGLVGVQVTIPLAEAGVGVQVVPGRVTVSPGVTPLQVTVLLLAVVHVGAVGGIVSTVTFTGAETDPDGVV